MQHSNTTTTNTFSAAARKAQWQADVVSMGQPELYPITKLAAFNTYDQQIVWQLNLDGTYTRAAFAAYGEEELLFSEVYAGK